MNNNTTTADVERLLAPRYKVIADYPGCGELKVGDILNLFKFKSNEWFLVKEFDTAGISALVIDEYPHLFRKLDWHEDREISEMPHFIKWRDMNNKLYVFNIQPSSYLDKKYMQWKFGGRRLKDFLPATAAEYEKYLNKK